MTKQQKENVLGKFSHIYPADQLDHCTESELVQLAEMHDIQLDDQHDCWDEIEAYDENDGQQYDEDEDCYLDETTYSNQAWQPPSSYWSQYTNTAKTNTQETLNLWGSSDGSTAWNRSAPVARRTSDSHPLAPSYIDVLNGRMGLVICPAKKGSGMVGQHDRDFEKDMGRLSDQGVDKIYGLMPKYELIEYKADMLLTETGTYGIEYIYCGWTDRSTPDNNDFNEMIQCALEDLKNGLTIVVHCRGGLGRTGTFAGTVLAEAGWHVDAMINALHDARGHMCPETKEQNLFIKTKCAQAMASRGDTRPIKDIDARAIRNALL